MILLEKFTLNSEFRCFKPFSISFTSPISIIVGDNGTGKSSFFELLTDYNYYNNGKITLKHVPDLEFSFIDTEKINLRVKNLNYEESNNLSIVASKIHSKTISHGEAALPLIEGINYIKNKLILIDEPEAGISLSNQKKVLDVFNTAVKNGCQIIFSTHSYFFIKNEKTVFNMELKKWETSNKFLSRLDL